ncbi:MAG: SPOR domain-containing protein [Comamonadaceae bacterium]|jgi:DedD protein|nr:SPOR domain-containing protein [Comamonadaceae bacterium]
MGLFSFLKRDDAAAAAPKKSAKSGAKAATADDVQLLRVRARRRLIGAAVLVAAGVVGFPLIFETQPRPIPVDLPIEIPRKEAVPPLVVPTREPLSQAEPAPPASPPAEEPRVAEKPVERSVERTPDKPAERLAEKPVEKPAERSVEKPADKPPVKLAEKHADKPVEKHADKPADKPKPAANDGARAQALLEGKEPAAAARFIVQVGAYGESKAAQEVRGKVEKLGLKTYAQAVDTADGRRVRVRLGPFASRDEAERAAAKLKGAGLPGAILTL